MEPARRQGPAGGGAPPPPLPPSLGFAPAGGDRPPHGRGGRGGGGRGGPPPPGRGGPPGRGTPAERLARREQHLKELRAALFKRQVAAMEVGPGALPRPDAERREAMLRTGPDIAPPSSYEEMPATQGVYWAEVLLPDAARLQAPSVSAPGVDHAGEMAAAMALHTAAPQGSVLMGGGQGADFAVDAALAELLKRA